MFCFECNSIEVYKMNEIINKFLLAGDKFMSKMPKIKKDTKIKIRKIRKER